MMIHPDPGLQTLKDLIREAEAQQDQIQRQLQEISILLRQNTEEVERLSQRSLETTNLLRQIEEHPEGYSKEEIMDAYAASEDTQLRLFIMRSQLEQLQSRETILKEQAEHLHRWVEIVEKSVPSPSTPVSEGTINRIIEAQEVERQRLARQMHDGPAQSLTNLILQAEVCERLFDTDPAKARAELANLRAAVHAAFSRTRRFIFDLRPMMLDDLGLIPTLRRYIQDFQEKSGSPVELRVTGQERRLPAHTEVTLFRVIQELLINIDRHAHAQRAQVALALEPDRVQVTVEDDGVGFDVEEVLAAAKERKTLGLSALQERVELLGGRADFESSIGHGTKVSIEIPIF